MIDKIYCINLDRDIERWRVVKPRIIDNGFPSVIRWSATDGKLLNINELPISIRAKFELTETRHSHESLGSLGAIGCYLSYVSILRDMIKYNYQRIITFEDDIYFIDDFNLKFTQAIDNLPEDVDVLIFGYYVIKEGVEYSSYYQLNGRFWGTFGIMFTQQGARKILANAFPIEVHFDAYLSFMSRVGNLKVLVTKENLCVNDTTIPGYKSNVSTPHDINVFEPANPIQIEPINKAKWI